MSGARRLLVLCVDNDDDIGQAIECQTPIIGRDAVLRAATLFAVKCPEDSDLNAMFAAVQVYDQMRRIVGEGNCEVALIAGLSKGGVESDMKIASELESVLRAFKADGVILVSDGPTDEQILPIISSRIPVISVRRVVVQQSRGIEEAFVIVTNYARKLVHEPRYRKYSLGLPGLFISLYTLLSALGLVGYAGTLFALLLGLLLVYKGFALGERLGMLRQYSPVKIASIMASAVILSIGVFSGAQSVMSLRPHSLNELIGFFFLTSIGRTLNVADSITISMLFFIGGRIVDGIVREGVVDWKDCAFFTFVLILRQILVELAKFMVGVGDFVALVYWSLFSVIASTVVASLFLTKSRLTRK
ncbi:MAG: hypothetical protein DRJ56_00225 [Thermoprotei archaeon]|nr:MAG: hypothetical protein DRJ56_00225 [Thermoprotei archaeon]